MIVDMTKINGIPLEAYINPAPQWLTLTMPHGDMTIEVYGVYHVLQPQRPKYRGFIKTVGRTMRKD